MVIPMMPPPRKVLLPWVVPERLLLQKWAMEEKGIKVAGRIFFSEL